MSRSKQTEPEKLTPEESALHRAVEAYVLARGGKTWIVGPARIEPRQQATAFAVIIDCVGKAPKPDTADKHE